MKNQNSYGNRKNRPSHAFEHAQAIIDDGIHNAARHAAKAAEEIAAHKYKLSKLPSDPALVPIVATIGQFADHDKSQGEAIDHSIATGEPLFAEPGEINEAA